MIAEVEAIKKLLLTEWDPIGVQGIPEAVDEYDSYAMPIYSLLNEGATIDAIAKYLEWVVIDRMGMSGNVQSSQNIAGRLLEIHKKYSAL